MNFDELNFEEELKNALARKEPAKGFAERVIQQVEPPAARRPQPIRGLRRWAALAVAASLTCGVFGVVRYEEYRKGERAKEQLMLALRITARSLGSVDRKLRE
jgi:hypothetical protein